MGKLTVSVYNEVNNNGKTVKIIIKSANLKGDFSKGSIKFLNIQSTEVDRWVRLILGIKEEKRSSET